MAAPYRRPTTDYEAVVLALTLALTAPDDASAAECAAIAESIATSLTAEQVANAKCEAWYAADCPPD